MRALIALLTLSSLYLSACNRDSSLLVNPVEPQRKSGQRFLDPDEPYNCRPGELDGPGVIGGKTLSNRGPLGRAMVMVHQAEKTRGGRGFTCSGVLVSDNTILTAAHCVDKGEAGSTAERITLIFDTDPQCTLSGGKNENMGRVSQVVIHPSWNKQTGKGTDLALLKIMGRAPRHADPLPVATGFVDMDQQTDIFAAGYGRESDLDVDDKDAAPPILRMAVIKPSKVSTVGLLNSDSADSYLFIQKEKGFLCEGDSGGPAVLMDKGELKVIGITSQVIGRGQKLSCTLPVQHTSVPFYQEWLSQTYDRLNPGRSSANPFRASRLRVSHAPKTR